MNRDLAIAVFDRWDKGLPVHEKVFYKAASILTEEPNLALAEARYYTILDSYLNDGGRMSDIEKLAFCLAYGNVKTASVKTGLDEYVLMKALCENEFIPDLMKIAFLGGNPQDAELQQNPYLRQKYANDPSSLQELTGNPAVLAAQDWQGNPMFKPSPTAPAQVPPGQGDGNMNQLLEANENKDAIEQQKQQQMMAQMAEQTKEQPQQGSKEQIQMLYNQMTPEQKLQHAAPQIAPEDIQRYAKEVANIEAQTGMKIKDPAQVKKIVGGVEKQEKKIIDDAIKQQFEAQQGDQGYGPLPSPEQLGGGSGAQQPVSPSPVAQAKLAFLRKMAETNSERANRYGLTGAVGAGVAGMGVPNLIGGGLGVSSSLASHGGKAKEVIDLINKSQTPQEVRKHVGSFGKALGGSVMRRGIGGALLGGAATAAAGYGAGRLVNRIAHGPANDKPVKLAEKDTRSEMDKLLHKQLTLQKEEAKKHPIKYIARIMAAPVAMSAVAGLATRSPLVTGLGILGGTVGGLIGHEVQDIMHAKTAPPKRKKEAQANFKVAASVDALAAGAKRFKGVIRARANQSLGIGNVGGAAYVPSSDKIISRAKNIYSKDVSPEFVKNLGISIANKVPKNIQGKIFTPKGGTFAAMKDQIPDFSNSIKNVSGDGQKAVNTMAKIHEGFERAIPASEATTFGTSHISPKVLLNEHNMISNISGPGGQEGANILRSLRESTGESEAMSSLFNQFYGPRATFQFGQGNKIPKAMKKNFAQKWQEHLLKQAALKIPGKVLLRNTDDFLRAANKLKPLSTDPNHHLEPTTPIS